MLRYWIFSGVILKNISALQSDVTNSNSLSIVIRMVPTPFLKRYLALNALVYPARSS